MAKRPLTQKEIAEKKKGSGSIIIENVSHRSGGKGQAVPFQVKKKGGDFYKNEHTITLAVGKAVSVDLESVMLDQIKNLAKRGLLSYKIKN